MPFYKEPGCSIHKHPGISSYWIQMLQISTIRERQRKYTHKKNEVLVSTNYVVTKKVDKSEDVVKERCYATTQALQKKPVNSVRITNQFVERSSLQSGDILSVLTQLSDIIVAYLKEGRTVSTDGLGNFYPSITSEAVDRPEECTVNKVWISRICFKAVPTFLNNARRTDFVNLQLRYGWKSTRPRNGSGKSTTDSVLHQ